MKKLVVSVLLTVIAGAVGMNEAVAQTTDGMTPIENLIERYSAVSGAKEIFAQGGRMIIARSILKETPVAPLAGDVKEVAVLKMANASPAVREKFVNSLHDTLDCYRFHGRRQTKNGMVDIYVLMTPHDDTVEELVIYNPTMYILNSLRGSFTVPMLLSLDQTAAL